MPISAIRKNLVGPDYFQQSSFSALPVQLLLVMDQFSTFYNERDSKIEIIDLELRHMNTDNGMVVGII